MNGSRVLIACVGNIFLGDDGFGTEVARRFAGRPLPPDVILKDFGIRGLDLTYALLDPYELVILVDACQRGGEPGTVYLIEPDPVESNAEARLEAHGLNPMNVLRTVKAMGGAPGRILIVGCEPAVTGSDEDGMLGLSEPVLAAVDEAVVLIESLVQRESSSDFVGRAILPPAGFQAGSEAEPPRKAAAATIGCPTIGKDLSATQR